MLQKWVQAYKALQSWASSLVKSAVSFDMSTNNTYINQDKINCFFIHIFAMVSMQI